MSAGEEFARGLAPSIQQILANADLELVSAKAVRKALAAQGVSEDSIKEHKTEIDAITAQTFSALRDVSAPEPAAVATPPSKSATPVTGSSKPRSSSSSKPAIPSKDTDDEAFARALQAELNGMGRPRASRNNPTGTPKKNASASASGSASGSAAKKRKIGGSAAGSSSGMGKYKSPSKVLVSDEEDEEDEAGGEDGASPAPPKKKKKRESSGNGEAPENGFNRPMLLSPALAELLNETHLSRPKAVKAIWAHIKTNNLQDPKDKRYIVCDEPMKKVFATNVVHMMGMNKILSKHLFNPDDVVGN